MKSPLKFSGRCLQSFSEFKSQKKYQSPPPRFSDFEQGNTQYSSKGGNLNSKAYRKSYWDSLNELYAQASQDGGNIKLESQLNLDLHGSQAEEQKDDYTQSKSVFQLNSSYIVSPIKSGIIYIDQQAAHERILFERFEKREKDQPIITQENLFPKAVELSPSQSDILNEIRSELANLGWNIEFLGGYSFSINAYPSWVNEDHLEEILAQAVDVYAQGLMQKHYDKKTNISHTLAKLSSIKKGLRLYDEQMKSIIDELFACQCPSISPSGEKTFWIMPFEQIQSHFSK